MGRDITLYTISQEFEYLADLLDRDVLEEEERKHIEKLLTEKIEQQSKEIVTYQIEESAKIEALGNEIKRLQALKKSAENRMEKFKDRLTENMRRLKCRKITTALGNVTLALDSVNKSVELKDGVDINTIPEKYLRISKELSKTAIKQALEEGEVIDGIEVKETPARVKFMLSKEAKDIQAEKAGE